MWARSAGLYVNRGTAADRAKPVPDNPTVTDASGIAVDEHHAHDTGGGVERRIAADARRASDDSAGTEEPPKRVPLPS